MGLRDQEGPEGGFVALETCKSPILVFRVALVKFACDILKLALGLHSCILLLAPSPAWHGFTDKMHAKMLTYVRH